MEFGVVLGTEWKSKEAVRVCGEVRVMETHSTM